MSLVQSYQTRGGQFHKDGRSSYGRSDNMGMRTAATGAAAAVNNFGIYDNHSYNMNIGTRSHDFYHVFTQNDMLDGASNKHGYLGSMPSSKRRKVSSFPCENSGRPYQHQYEHRYDYLNEQPKPSGSYFGPQTVSHNSTVVAATRHDGANSHGSTTSKRDRSKFEEDEIVFMSRDEIERCSPSRKDGIDSLHETHLRYSYCAFLQNLGIRLDLPQTTIGTAMVLCHRFFLRRSHAAHDRFLIATAVLFLASKSEETSRPLNDVLKASSEIIHNQEFTLLSYMFPIDWFDQYRERITEAEQLVLTTLNFELNVQHPYESLTSTLQKIGFSHPFLVKLALTLVSEGLRSSLWLQFKPPQIAAGAAYLAAKFLNLNLASCHAIWNEFHTPPSVLKDVAHQLMELF